MYAHTSFNLDMCPCEGAKLIIVETWGGGGGGGAGQERDC